MSGVLSSNQLRWLITVEVLRFKPVNQPERFGDDRKRTRNAEDKGEQNMIGREEDNEEEKIELYDPLDFMCLADYINGGGKLP